jgi:hypothetical protein
LVARIWKPRCGSPDLVARIWKARSGSKSDEKTLFFTREVGFGRKIMILAVVL